MKLTKAHVKNFRSIEDSNEVLLEPTVTVLVGQNESGKTGFLQALDRTNSVNPKQKFDPIEDYPRRYLSRYQRDLAADPPVVVTLSYTLEGHEIDAIRTDTGCALAENFAFTVSFKYGGGKSIDLRADEASMVAALLAEDPYKTSVATQVGTAKTLKILFERLDNLDLNEAATSATEALRSKYLVQETKWDSLLSLYIYRTHIAPKLPQFVYFDDYKLLPGKVNLPTFHQRVASSASQKTPLSDQDSTVQSLLRMAGVSFEELNNPANYETIKAKLEAFSNEITDNVFRYWKQNKELDVQFDIKSDSNDEAPFNSGNNLYIRIYSRRHRVSMPFDRRSKGFIWFFSFIIWFDSVKEEVQAKNDLILLLDEPGLSLHALAQADFLEYISELSANHQVIYTTHSPFMVRSDGLSEVRVVQDQADQGTKISSNLGGSDSKTLFPLQAALGYTIAQNLFISERNLLVEGPSELLYFNYLSASLESVGREGLRADITIVPAGGLDKVATFVSLLGANELQIVVLHDYEKNSAQNLIDLIKLKIIEQKRVHTFSEYRKKNSTDGKELPSDIEDLFPVGLYLECFNACYVSKLKNPLVQSKLPPGDRIVERISRHLATNGESLRPSGGFNHYLVAQTLCARPVPDQYLNDLFAVFETMFNSVNKLYT